VNRVVKILAVFFMSYLLFSYISAGRRPEMKVSGGIILHVPAFAGAIHDLMPDV
jgi:hypothetical protein